MKNISLVNAVEDLKTRTLASLSTELAKLVYLSSTRDYLTGRYYHDGLAFRFDNRLAEVAVGFCHHELFEKIAVTPLGDLVQELEAFFHSQQATPREVLDTWTRLQPYRMLIPQSSNPVSRELFFSNIRISLAILDSRLGKNPPHAQQSASQQR